MAVFLLSGFVFFLERRSVPTFENSKKCDQSFKWCTYTDLELEKCKWLSQAALNEAIQPVVECVRSDNDDEISCLDNIKKGTSDVVMASSDYAYITLKYYKNMIFTIYHKHCYYFRKGLTGLAFPETDFRNLSSILVVKNSSETTINSFEDLKNKRLCLPRYGGKGIIFL